MLLHKQLCRCTSRNHLGEGLLDPLAELRPADIVNVPPDRPHARPREEGEDLVLARGKIGVGCELVRVKECLKQVEQALCHEWCVSDCNGWSRRLEAGVTKLITRPLTESV